jgi:hypothetical protein
MAFRCPDRRNCERNFDQASVLSLANGFITVDALAAFNALKDRRFFV